MQHTDSQSIEIEIEVSLGEHALREAELARHAAEELRRGDPGTEPLTPIVWRRRRWSGGPAFVGHGNSGVVYHAWGGMTWTLVATTPLGEVISTASRRSRAEALDLAATWEAAHRNFAPDLGRELAAELESELD